MDTPENACRRTGCGRPLPRNRNRGRKREWCSESCRVRAYRIKKPLEKRAKIAFACIECGSATLGRRRAQCCSRRCGNRITRRLYRGRLRLLGRDKIAKQLLGERDGWKCWICSGAVDPALSPSRPLGASIDHVLPVAAGGSHTWDNVRLAHLVCNTRRGTAGMLRLPAPSLEAFVRGGKAMLPSGTCRCCGVAIPARQAARYQHKPPTFCSRRCAATNRKAA